jgi:hypothetical protein
MGRTLNRLSAVAVNTGISRRGMHHDGGGLYLQVSAGGAKSWIFRFMLDGRPREMGLGPLHTGPPCRGPETRDRVPQDASRWDRPDRGPECSAGQE